MEGEGAVGEVLLFGLRSSGCLVSGDLAVELDAEVWCRSYGRNGVV